MSNYIDIDESKSQTLWNIHGVIPPIVDTYNGASPNRSPYAISVLDFVQQYAFSSERHQILLKFLDYRQQVCQLGIQDGFQWVNGSFTENVERIKGRPPNDIDVVNFVIPSNEINEEYLETHQYIFQPSTVKQVYQVDAYWVDLTYAYQDPRYLIEQTAYWYSMWSHQRDTNIWKGFYQIDFNLEEDNKARQWLIDNPCDTGVNDE